MVNISVKLKNLNLKNPTVLTSGFLGTTGDILKEVIKSGAGAVTTKTIFIEARKGNENPIIVEFEHGLLNAVGLPSPGLEVSIEEIKEAKKSGIPLIASIGAKTTDEFVKVAQAVEEAGADAIELNFSCPHAETGLGINIQNNRNVAKQIVTAVKSNVSIPLIVKLMAEHRIVDIVKSIEEVGADIVACSNTIGPGIVIDLNTAKPILTNKEGGVSGPAIKPIALRAVYQIAKNTDLPIIGTGGICSGEDAIEYIMAGATAVGIGTAILYYDLEVFKKICQEIMEWMEKKGYKNLEEIRGLALR